MSKAKMQAARELIKEKRYSEARAILETVDHPVAVDWLIRLDEIAPVEKSKRSENTSQIKRLLMPRRGRSRLYWIGFTVFLCFGCYIFSVFGQIFGFIPTTEELNVTRTLEASTQVAQIATEDAVRVSTSVAQVATLTAEIVSQQMATDAQATNVALMPTSTLLMTATELPSEIPLPTVDIAATQDAILLVTVQAGQTQVAINNAAILTEMAITDTPMPTNTTISTPTPTMLTFNEAEYQRVLFDGLYSGAARRNIDSILIPDGRANGGNRAAIISFLTIETSEIGYLVEIVEIFEAVAKAIRANKLDLDEVVLLAGTSDGVAIGTISVSVEDLLAYSEGRITQSEFISIFQIVTF